MIRKVNHCATLGEKVCDWSWHWTPQIYGLCIDGSIECKRRSGNCIPVYNNVKWWIHKILLWIDHVIDTFCGWFELRHLSSVSHCLWSALNGWRYSQPHNTRWFAQSIGFLIINIIIQVIFCLQGHSAHVSFVLGSHIFVLANTQNKRRFIDGTVGRLSPWSTFLPVCLDWSKNQVCKCLGTRNYW